MSTIILTREVPVYITDTEGALAPTEETLAQGLEISLDPEGKEETVIFLVDDERPDFQKHKAYRFFVKGYGGHRLKVLERDIQDMMQSPTLIQTAP